MVDTRNIPASTPAPIDFVNFQPLTPLTSSTGHPHRAISLPSSNMESSGYLPCNYKEHCILLPYPNILSKMQQVTRIASPCCLVLKKGILQGSNIGLPVSGTLQQILSKPDTNIWIILEKKNTSTKIKGVTTSFMNMLGELKVPAQSALLELIGHRGCCPRQRTFLGSGGRKWDKATQSRFCAQEREVLF